MTTPAARRRDDGEAHPAGSPRPRRQPLRLGAMAATLRACAAVRLSEPEIRGLAQLVPPGGICFDIGAAYGMYTFPLAQLVGPHGQVLSFEPLPNPFRILAAGVRASGAGNIRIHNAAMGPRSESAQLTLPHRFGLPIHGWAYLRTGMERPGRDFSFGAERILHTRVRTVDEICAEQGIDRVDFIKADVEGFESAVLDGAEKTIEARKPALLLEIEDRHLDKYGMTAESMAGALRERGYTMYHCRGGRWVPAAAVTDQCRNYLFAADGAFG
ncbi:FkbM family methyltransferase [Streptomonospora sediminis]